MMLKKWLACAALCGTLLLTGCAGTSGPNYAVSDHEIRSVLVVPVVNDTATVGADLLMYSTSTMPLAERGYYVYPADTVKMVLEAEGLYEPERIHALEPAKLADMFHADSVLFIKVIDWDAKYLVLGTRTTVAADYAFYKKDGTKLWERKLSLYRDSNSGHTSSLLGMMIDMAVAAVNRAAPEYKPLAKQVNNWATAGWEPGPYNRADEGKTAAQ